MVVWEDACRGWWPLTCCAVLCCAGLQEAQGDPWRLLPGRAARKAAVCAGLCEHCVRHRHRVTDGPRGRHAKAPARVCWWRSSTVVMQAWRSWGCGGPVWIVDMLTVGESVCGTLQPTHMVIAGRPLPSHARTHPGSARPAPLASPAGHKTIPTPGMQCLAAATRKPSQKPNRRAPAFELG